MTTAVTPVRPARRAPASLLLALLLALAPLGVAFARQRPAPRGRAGSARPNTTPAPPQTSQAPRTAEAWQRPRLVLLIAVDQFRYDYLERFGDLFAAGGLRRLQREGGSWTNANFDHVPTETAPGHATMMTGAWPAETGIIANDWYERNAKGDGGSSVNNVSDPDATLIGGGAKERASTPRRLLVSTLGDELRLRSAGRAKVVGVSLKDRSAILPAGRHANAAFWYSVENGRMVSSDYYFKDKKLPEWVTRFNAARPADRYVGQEWTKFLKGEDAKQYELRAGVDDAPWENQGSNAERYTKTFPHKFPAEASALYYDLLQTSPFTDEVLVEFAREAITNERLGDDGETDVLTVSFSALDYVGHRFGPYSQEVMDTVLRVDRQIAALLDFVDARVGLRNTVVAFTADHGVAPVPEQAAQLGLPGRRVKQSDVRAKIKEALSERFKRPNDSRERGEDYFLEYTAKSGNVYLNLEALRRDGVSREEAERVACEGAMKVAGFARCFTRTQLERGAVSPADAVARRVLHGFNPLRSGDVVLSPQAFNLVVTYAADHYAPYSYDTHVPVIIMGGGVAPGRYTQPATPADIAPTLARLIRAESPSNAVGRVLVEGIKQ